MFHQADTGRSIYLSVQYGQQTMVNLESQHLGGMAGQLHRERANTRSDFQNPLIRLQARRGNGRQEDVPIRQEVLPVPTVGTQSVFGQQTRYMGWGGQVG